MVNCLTEMLTLVLRTRQAEGATGPVRDPPLARLELKSPLNFAGVSDVELFINQLHGSG